MPGRVPAFCRRREILVNGAKRMVIKTSMRIPKAKPYGLFSYLEEVLVVQSFISFDNVFPLATPTRQVPEKIFRHRSLTQAFIGRPHLL